MRIKIRNKRADRAKFSKGVAKTKSINLPGHLVARGGKRL